MLQATGGKEPTETHVAIKSCFQYNLYSVGECVDRSGWIPSASVSVEMTVLLSGAVSGGLAGCLALRLAACLAAWPFGDVSGNLSGGLDGCLPLCLTACVAACLASLAGYAAVSGSMLRRVARDFQRKPK